MLPTLSEKECDFTGKAGEGLGGGHRITLNSDCGSHGHRNHSNQVLECIKLYTKRMC